MEHIAAKESDISVRSLSRPKQSQKELSSSLYSVFVPGTFLLYTYSISVSVSLLNICFFIVFVASPVVAKDMFYFLKKSYQMQFMISNYSHWLKSGVILEVIILTLEFFVPCSIH